MKTKLFLVALALFSVPVSLRADVHAGNFWPNPTFEAGTGASPTGTPDFWNRGGNDGTILQWSTANSVSPTHSLAINKPVAGPYGEWYEDFAIAGFANPGDTIGLHWHEMYSISGGEMRLTVRLLDGGGGGTNSGDHHFVVTGNSVGWNTTPANSTFSVRNEVNGGNAGLLGPIVVAADTVYLRIQLVSGGPDSTFGNYLIDDLSAYVVPEPSTIALLSVAGLVGLGVLRRRKIAS